MEYRRIWSTSPEPYEVINEIEADFQQTTQRILSKKAEVSKKLGSKLDTYYANRKALSEWYSYTNNEATKLFSRTRLKSHQFYKSVADRRNTENFRISMSEMYNSVCLNCMVEMYNSVRDAYVNFYEVYYMDIIGNSYSSYKYEFVSDLSNSFYNEWSGYVESFNDVWFRESADFSDNYFNIQHAFNDGNFDIDSLLK